MCSTEEVGSHQVDKRERPLLQALTSLCRHILQVGASGAAVKAHEIASVTLLLADAQRMQSRVLQGME